MKEVARGTNMWQEVPTCGNRSIRACTCTNCSCCADRQYKTGSDTMYSSEELQPSSIGSSCSNYTRVNLRVEVGRPKLES
jgi:hypothetical protein